MTTTTTTTATMKKKKFDFFSPEKNVGGVKREETKLQKKTFKILFVYSFVQKKSFIFFIKLSSSRNSSKKWQQFEPTEVATTEEQNESFIRSQDGARCRKKTRLFVKVTQQNNYVIN